MAGEFAGDAGGDELGIGLVGGGEGHGVELTELGQAENEALAQGGEHAQGVGGATAGLLGAASVIAKRVDEAAGGIDGLGFKLSGVSLAGLRVHSG